MIKNQKGRLKDLSNFKNYDIIVGVAIQKKIIL
jgi:hypothetical protein